MAQDGTAGSAAGRIVSLDQFRGYTVAGMILVNGLDHFALIHATLKHNNTYFSYADSIMPAFHFAVGFALRLTLLRRLATNPARSVYTRVVSRCLGLVVLSLVLAPADHYFKTWEKLQSAGVWSAIAGPLKCEFWETLAIIGVTSLWVLPVIAASARMRISFMVVCATLHVVLSHLFYFHFLYARPNGLDGIWGAANVKGLDGGPFGFLIWSIPQLVGSLAYDAVSGGRKESAWSRLLAWSVVLMGIGYGLSCLSMLYPVTDPPDTHERGIQIAESPVLPPGPDSKEMDFRRLLAPPPFTRPVLEEQRQLNYWLMCKRACTLPFMLFATGFALVIYALFVRLCDRGSLQVGLFRTFGQNALAVYIIHGLANRSLAPYSPSDSPLWWILIVFVLLVGVTYVFVRHLEKNGIYLRM